MSRRASYSERQQIDIQNITNAAWEETDFQIVMTSKVIYKISKKNVTSKDNPISPAVVIVVWSQFVDNLFIVRLRLNMLMRRAVIIIF